VPPALCITLIFLIAGEFRKNCISTPVRCTMFRSRMDVSAPLRFMAMRTPEKECGGCSRVTVSTDPTRIRLGCRREKSTSIMRCALSETVVLCRYSMRFFPLSSVFGLGSLGTGRTSALPANGYALVGGVSFAAAVRRIDDVNMLLIMSERETCVQAWMPFIAVSDESEVGIFLSFFCVVQLDPDFHQPWDTFTSYGTWQTGRRSGTTNSYADRTSMSPVIPNSRPMSETRLNSSSPNSTTKPSRHASRTGAQ